MSIQTTETIWFNGELIPWNDAQVHVMTHALHYGCAAFEGILFYATEKGLAVRCLDEHVDRLFYSASCLGMEIPYSKHELRDAILSMVAKSGLSYGYVRPIVFTGYGKFGVSPFGAPIEVAIGCISWGEGYLNIEKASLAVSPIIRLHPESTSTDAKIAGNYVNNIHSILYAKKKGVDLALTLDYEGYVAEGTSANFFMFKDGVLITPVGDTFFPGITRKIVMDLAQDLGHEVREMKFKPELIHEADEVFLTGTAAEVLPIYSFEGKALAREHPGSLTAQMKSAYKDVVLGKNPKYEKLLTYIPHNS